MKKKKGKRRYWWGMGLVAGVSHAGWRPHAIVQLGQE